MTHRFTEAELRQKLSRLRAENERLTAEHSVALATVNTMQLALLKAEATNERLRGLLKKIKVELSSPLSEPFHKCIAVEVIISELEAGE